jgi:hypothetical protein
MPVLALSCLSSLVFASNKQNHKLDFLDILYWGVLLKLVSAQIPHKITKYFSEQKCSEEKFWIKMKLMSHVQTFPLSYMVFNIMKQSGFCAVYRQ